MKKIFLKFKNDFINHVKPKWKFFATIILTLTIINGVFYVLTHIPNGIANSDDHTFNYFILTMVAFMNIAFVCMIFKEYKQKDFMRIKSDMMETFLQDMVLKDETIYKLSDLYNDTPDFLKRQLVSVLFEAALIKSRKSI